MTKSTRSNIGIFFSTWAPNYFSCSLKCISFRWSLMRIGIVSLIIKITLTTWFDETAVASLPSLCPWDKRPQLQLSPTPNFRAQLSFNHSSQIDLELGAQYYNGILSRVLEGWRTPTQMVFPFLLWTSTKFCLNLSYETSILGLWWVPNVSSALLPWHLLSVSCILNISCPECKNGPAN